MEFDILHQSYSPSTNQLRVASSRNMRYREAWPSSVSCMSHSSRRHSPAHHSPALLHGPDASVTRAFLFANPIQTGDCSALVSTLAGITGRNLRRDRHADGRVSLCLPGGATWK